MLSGITAGNMAANEAVLPDDMSTTLTGTGKIDTITYSRLYYNKETEVEELVPYLELTLKWNVSDVWVGMSKNIIPLDQKYMNY